MTLLQIVNQVLVKLRQTQVTTPTENTYSTLITQLVNEARREIEDAWNWMALRQTVTVTTVADSNQYILSGIGNSRFKVIEVIDDTNDHILENLPSKELTRKFIMNEEVTDKPLYYGFNGFDSNGDPVVDLYPVPDDEYEIRFNLVIPQNDTTSGPTQISVPGHIVVLGAYVKAIAERGEDGSSAYEVANAAYIGALATAISQEGSLMPNETDWNAV